MTRIKTSTCEKKEITIGQVGLKATVTIWSPKRASSSVMIGELD